MDAEYEAELERSQALEEAHGTRMAEAQRQAETLADALLDGELERAQLRQERRSLALRAAELTPRTQLQSANARALVEGARTLCEHLSVHLAEVAAATAVESEVRELAAQLNAAEPSSLAVVEQVVRAFDRVHRQDTSVQIRNERLWTATNVQEDCEVLAVGSLFFAYRTLRDARIGLALEAPADAHGYRFTEELTSDVRESLERAFEQLGQSSAAEVSFPIDPSGSLRVEDPPGSTSLLQSLRDGGLVMVPLGLVAALALALILERAFTLFLRSPLELRRARAVLDASADGDFARAEQLCREPKGVVVRTLAHCLARREESPQVLEDTVQERLLHELPQLRRSLGGIASLAAVAPLLGLLGTVTGIIRTFGIIRAFGNSNPALMAGGISEALVTTAVGMSIAIPVLLVHVVLRARVDRAVAETERHAATLLTTLHAWRDDDDRGGAP